MSWVGGRGLRESAGQPVLARLMESSVLHLPTSWVEGGLKGTMAPPSSFMHSPAPAALTLELVNLVPLYPCAGTQGVYVKKQVHAWALEEEHLGLQQPSFPLSCKPTDFHS